LPVGHYENFPVASIALPRRLRPAVIAIYRFARTADDIADEGDARAEQRLAALAALREGLGAIERGRGAALPEPIASLAGAVAEHALPTAPLHALLDAFEQDVGTTRYETWDELLDYCRKSANPVGNLMLHLYRAATPRNLERSDAICSALQLINFWQDVAIDWRKGRVYLPQEDLRRHGVSEAQIAAGRSDERWRALIDFEVDRTRRLLDFGRPLGEDLPGRIGLELRMIVAGGTRVLDRIAAVGGDVFRRRPRLGVADWIAIVGRSLIPRHA
jgi:squalene synthase HpnC